MNVLLMVSWYGPQGETLQAGGFHYEMAKELIKYCNCAIYYPYDRNIQEPYTSGIEWGIQTYRSQYELRRKFRNRRYMYLAMNKIVHEFHPDIIHGQVATEAGRFAVVLGHLFRIPVIISEHSAVDVSGVREFPHYYYARYAYGHSCYNTCVSDQLTSDLSELFPKYEFHTVYNGIIKPEVKKSASLYREKNFVNIVMIAEMYDRYIKGIQFVLPVLQRLVQSGYPVMLHLIGGGEYLEEYKAVADDLKINTHCVFYGACSKQKVYDILSEMDFFVCASIFESFSCATAEAMICGKPVVATKCGGPNSFVTKETGILVEKESEQALYNGILDMIKDFRKYSPEAISAYACDKFLIENIGRQYMQIYENVRKCYRTM